MLAIAAFGCDGAAPLDPYEPPSEPWIHSDRAFLRDDADTLAFELTVNGRGDEAPHVLYLPESYPAFRARCGDREVTPTPEREARTGRVEVICAGPGERTLTVSSR